MKQIAIIGAGGIGSFLIGELERLAENDQLANIHFTVFDGDIVEHKNLKYQNFVEKDIGKNKAQAMLGKCVFLDMVVNKVFANAKDLTGFDAVVSCVDSSDWRKEMFKVLEPKGTMWIDLRSEGRAIAAYMKSKKNTLETMLATLPDTRERGSCQNAFELENNVVQIGNRIVAMIGVQMILNYTRGDTGLTSISLMV